MVDTTTLTSVDIRHVKDANVAIGSNSSVSRCSTTTDANVKFVFFRSLIKQSYVKRTPDNDRPTRQTISLPFHHPFRGVRTSHPPWKTPTVYQSLLRDLLSCLAVRITSRPTLAETLAFCHETIHPLPYQNKMCDAR